MVPARFAIKFRAGEDEVSPFERLAVLPTRNNIDRRISRTVSRASTTSSQAKAGRTGGEAHPYLGEQKPPQCKALQGLHLISRGDWI